VNRLTLVNKERIRNLQPAYFALVMATSIVAIACQLEHLSGIAELLTTLNAAMFVVLTSLTLTRLVLFPLEVKADIMNHARAPGFLTMAAGSALLGCEFILIARWYTIAFVLWIASIIAWVFLTYTIFATFTVKESKPALDQGINGGWLLAVVSTQAVAQLALLLIPTNVNEAEELLFFGLALWLWGGMLYIWMISLIFYRYTFFTFAPSDLMPPYWINMGAMAISTLVGVLVAERISGSALKELRPFVEGFTIFFWVTATWWIPMLVILGYWRHIAKRFPLSYDPLYWGAVFPLGVYSVATYRLAEFWQLRFLFWVPKCFTYIALAAWLATFVGMTHATLRPRVSTRNSHEP
jgi:tellurite resistance protein TehA-like permease